MADARIHARLARPMTHLPIRKGPHPYASVIRASQSPPRRDQEFRAEIRNAMTFGYMLGGLYTFNLSRNNKDNLTMMVGTIAVMLYCVTNLLRRTYFDARRFFSTESKTKI